MTSRGEIRAFMKATISVIFSGNRFRIKTIDTCTGRPPQRSLAEFYTQAYQVDDALARLGLNANQRAYLMMPQPSGASTTVGVELPDD